MALLRYHVRHGHIEAVRAATEELGKLLPLASDQAAGIEQLLADTKLNPPLRSCLERLLLRHWQMTENP